MREQALMRCCVLLALASCACAAARGQAQGEEPTGGQAQRQVPGEANAPRVTGAPPVAAHPVPPAKNVETRLFLVGDAGTPLVDDPVLASLSRELHSNPKDAVVVYLGDNIYPRGLPPADSPGRKEAERRIDAQMKSVPEGARAIFIPGNHDWNRMGPGGLEAIRRQGEYIREKGAGRSVLEPERGCPGPVTIDIQTQLRLVLLDTQWWLQPGERPSGPSSGCEQGSEKQVVDALARTLADAGTRRVVVAGHHPLATGGSHGGYFSWRDHIFPLRAKKSWLWIPLPGVGSIYPLTRMRGWSDQDMSGPKNRKLREALSGVFEKTPPLVYVAGHEHSLQVIEGKKPKYMLVSGAGAFGHVTETAWTHETLYAAALSGYMRIDVEKDGRARLAVVTVDGKAKATEAIAFDLTAQPEAQKPKVAPAPGTVVEPAQQPKEQKPGKPETEPEPTKPPEVKPEERKPQSTPPGTNPEPKPEPKEGEPAAGRPSGAGAASHAEVPAESATAGTGGGRGR